MPAVQHGPVAPSNWQPPERPHQHADEAVAGAPQLQVGTQVNALDVGEPLLSRQSAKLTRIDQAAEDPTLAKPVQPYTRLRIC